MVDFVGDDLRDSRFERVDLSGAEFRSTRFGGARFRVVDLRGDAFLRRADMNLYAAKNGGRNRTIAG